MTTGPCAAYIALGSNLDGPETQVKNALAALSALQHSRLIARSRLYRSPAMGPAEQPDYINAVVALSTTLSARALLDELLRIERAQGRVRAGARWGPRRLDLDLLLFGNAVIDEPGLTVPHPGLTQRAFVLYPLAELAPELVIPGAGTVNEVLTGVPADGLMVVEDR